VLFRAIDDVRAKAVSRSGFVTFIDSTGIGKLVFRSPHANHQRQRPLGRDASPGVTPHPQSPRLLEVLETPTGNSGWAPRSPR